MKLNIKFTRAVVFAALLFLSAYIPAKASTQNITGKDLTVNCKIDKCSHSKEKIDCELSGGGGLSGTALFYETGLLPGDSITRKIVFSADTQCSCTSIHMDTKNETQTYDDGVGFSENLFTAIYTPFNNIFGTHSGGYALPDKNLNELFDNGPIFFGKLHKNETKSVYWTVTVDQNSPNYLQNGSAKFDFDMEFMCGNHLGDVKGDKDKDEKKDEKDNNDDDDNDKHSSSKFFNFNKLKKWYKEFKRGWFLSKIAVHLSSNYDQIR